MYSEICGNSYNKIKRCVPWDRVKILHVFKVNKGLPELHEPEGGHARPSICLHSVLQGEVQAAPPGGTLSSDDVLQALPRDSWYPALKPLPYFSNQNQTTIFLVISPKRLIKLVT